MKLDIKIKPGDIVARLRKMNSWSLALLIFLFCVTLFLSVRASDKYRWSDWGFGDAQTMLSLKQWEEGGWFKNYFLFAPQGYAQVCSIFDDPQLRQHAHGTCPGSSPRVGPRLLYTHYPAGYLVPYAVLFRLGIDSLFAVRMLSILFSVGALIFMYMVFSRITKPGIAFFAVFFYGLTPTFLGYADALANQPLDDLLRFGFMLAVVMSTRAGSDDHKKIWLITAWATEFMLSMSSFDSVFFMYVWLVGWDLIDNQGFRLKRYLLFSLAPVSAHGLQFIQNVWYLGLNDAVIDIKDAFLLKNAADPNYNLGQGRMTVIADTIVILFNNLYNPAVFIIGLSVLYVIYYFLVRDKMDREMPSVMLLALLFLSGLSFVLILPHAARMPYESRQMIPFVALLSGAVAYSFLKEFGKSIHIVQGSENTGLQKFRKITGPLYLFVAAVFLIVFWYRFTLNERQPVYYIPDEKTDAQYEATIRTGQRMDLMRYRSLREEVLLAEELAKIRPAYDPVIFSIDGFQLFWDPAYVPGYPQIMPITEYYAGSRPILCFDAPEALVDDMLYMIQNGPSRFSPLIVSRNFDLLRHIADRLNERGMLIAFPQSPPNVMGKFVLDLTDHIAWIK